MAVCTSDFGEYLNLVFLPLYKDRGVFIQDVFTKGGEQKPQTYNLKPPIQILNLYATLSVGLV